MVAYAATRRPDLRHIRAPLPGRAFHATCSATGGSRARVLAPDQRFVLPSYGYGPRSGICTGSYREAAWRSPDRQSASRLRWHPVRWCTRQAGPPSSPAAPAHTRPAASAAVSEKLSPSIPTLPWRSGTGSCSGYDGRKRRRRASRASRASGRVRLAARNRPARCGGRPCSARMAGQPASSRCLASRWNAER